MMKKVLIVVMLSLLLMGGRVGHAIGLSPAAQADTFEMFERYQSYKIDGSGEWMAYDLMAAQLLRTIASGEARSLMNTGILIMYPHIRGNALLGYTEIVLNVCLLKTQPLYASSVSILVGDVRHDFLAAPKKEQIGNYSWERFELPMNEQGIEMLSAIATSGCAVSVYAGDKQYRTTIRPNENDAAGKQAVEGASIKTIRSMLKELDGVYLSQYMLWDLNASYWSVGRPQMACVRRSSEPYGEDCPMLDEAFQSLVTNDQAAVLRMQQLLKDASFYAGKVDGKIGSDTLAAIREAQRFYGLLQTGQADRTLIDRLTGVDSMKTLIGDIAQPQAVRSGETVQGEAGIDYRCEVVAQLQINRYWMAKELRPTNAMKSPNPSSGASNSPTRNVSSDITATSTLPITQSTELDVITPVNSSNYMLVFDGEITNLCTESVFLPLCIQAEATINDQYSYTCTVRSEQSEGKRFGTQLLPLEHSRIILYVEVPRHAAENDVFKLTINISTAKGMMNIEYVFDGLVS